LSPMREKRNRRCRIGERLSRQPKDRRLVVKQANESVSLGD